MNQAEMGDGCPEIPSWIEGDLLCEFIDLLAEAEKFLSENGWIGTNGNRSEFNLDADEEKIKDKLSEKFQHARLHYYLVKFVIEKHSRIINSHIFKLLSEMAESYLKK